MNNRDVSIFTSTKWMYRGSTHEMTPKHAMVAGFMTSPRHSTHSASFYLRLATAITDFSSLNCPAPCRVWTRQLLRFTLMVVHLFISMNPTQAWASDAWLGHIYITPLRECTLHNRNVILPWSLFPNVVGGICLQPSNPCHPSITFPSWSKFLTIYVLPNI